MLQEKITQPDNNPQVKEIAIDGFDHIEFYVGNAKQASHYYQQALGFELIAYRGLETGERREVSYVLRQDHVYFVLTGALQSDSLVSDHVKRHGDGVKTIAFRVRDARESYETALVRGAEKASEFEEYEGPNGLFRSGSVHTYGDTIHKFVERREFKGAFAPGFRNIDNPAPIEPVGLAAIDHVVGSVERARLDYWVDFYKNVFGFYVYQYFGDEDISTEYSSLVSPVMANRSGSIKLPFIAPAPGRRKSQVEEYLDYYQAPGVQHIAIATRNIIPTAAKLSGRGVEFLNVPLSYYEALPERVGKIDEEIEKLAQLGILVDRETEGYLLQIFTKPVQDRPTLFFEVIQRKGAKGFGKGNFKALFESIEREQARRGNL